MNTTKLQLPLLAAAQAQKHVTHNEALLKLDALVQVCAESRTVTAQPASPSDGDVYVLPPGKTGTDWGEYADYSLAHYRDGVWVTYPPREGWIAWVKDSAERIVFNGSDWGMLSELTKIVESASEVVVNEDSADLDFRVESDDNTHALFVQGSDGRLGFGTDTPENTIHIRSASPFVIVESTNSGTATFNFKNTSTTNGLQIGIDAQENARVLQRENTDIYFSTNDTERLRLHANGGLVMAGASGGSQGSGTINAGAVYDDGTLLSCYVIQSWLDGDIDPEAWDALVPDRIDPAVVDNDTGELIEAERVIPRAHKRAREFREVAAERLNLDMFADWVRTNRHLPAFPGPQQWADPTKWNRKMSSGEATQRLWETIELLAVHIIEIHERTKRLESR